MTVDKRLQLGLPTFDTAAFLTGEQDLKKLSEMLGIKGPIKRLLTIPTKEDTFEREGKTWYFYIENIRQMYFSHFRFNDFLKNATPYLNTRGRPVLFLENSKAKIMLIIAPCILADKDDSELFA